MDLWQSYLDIYSSLPKHCERSGSFFSEPINTISNIGFFISAYFAYSLLKNNKVEDVRLSKLPFLITLIGIGSALYHAFNSPYTLLADQLPIFIFITYFLYILLNYLIKNNILSFCIPVLLVILQLAVIINTPLFVLGMPTRHVINFLFVTILLIWVYQKLGRIALGIIPALFFYGLGIFVRIFESQVCLINGFGIHFIWHFCVALSTYLSLSFLVKIYQRRY